MISYSLFDYIFIRRRKLAKMRCEALCVYIQAPTGCRPFTPEDFALALFWAVLHKCFKMPLEDDMNVDLPVIDISNVDSQTGVKILQATSRWGFVYLSIHCLGILPQDTTRPLVLYG